MYVTVCDKRPEQFFQWNPTSQLVRSVKTQLCMQRDGDAALRMRPCAPTSGQQKFLAADSRIKMSAFGNWQICVASLRNDYKDNLVSALNCWTTPDDRVKYTMFSNDVQSKGPASKLTAGTGKLAGMVGKSTFW